MNKSVFSLILSSLAIIIAGIAAFSLELNLENASFTLGTLSLLVTLLVGWQIYNKIAFDAKVQKAIDKQVSLGANTALFVALAQQGKSAYNRDDKADAIQSLLNALCVWQKEMKSPLAKEAYDYCIVKLTMLSKEVGFGVENVEEKDAYLKAALNTGNRTIIDFVTNIKVSNDKS
jgi:hypothetical protein